MKLKEAIDNFMSTNWKKEYIELKHRCNYCKKPIRTGDLIIFCYRFDGNYKIQFKTKFVCTDCIKKLS